MPSLAVPTGGPAVPLLDPSTALIGAQPSAEVYTALATRVESLLNLSPTASVTPVVSDEGDSLYDPVGPFYSDVGAIDDPCQDVPSLMRQFMDHSLLINNSTDDSKLTSCFLEFVTACPSRDMTACPTKFDGVSCWPETPPGTMRAIPCFDEFNGVGYDSSENATLYCHANGTWSEKSFYDLCLNTTLSTSESLLPTFNTTKTIFYVGNSASLAAVTVALWIFLTFKDLRCLRNSIHINLLLTYFLHNLFWIIYAAIQPLMGMIVSCSFYVALTYFVFTNFMWMFVEGLYLYMLVVITFSVEDFRLRVYTLIGWGIPIPIIISWVLVKLYVTQYQDDGSDLSEENEMGGMILDTPVEEEGYHCPLIYETPIDWMHQGPVMLLLSTNIIFLMRIMWVLITKLRSANTVETQRYRKATKALLVLIPLLGLTYMLLIALPQELEHIRAILLSTQGFWVALFYCFLNSEVQNSIRHHIERWKTARGIGEVQRGASIRQGIRDGSPRSRSCLSRWFFGNKRESLTSEVTTLSTLVSNGFNIQGGQTPRASLFDPKPDADATAQPLVDICKPRNSSPRASLLIHKPDVTEQPTVEICKTSDNIYGSTSPSLALIANESEVDATAQSLVDLCKTTSLHSAQVTHRV